MRRIAQPRRVAVRAEERELGFGRTMTTEGRLMNADGSFNVVRQRTSPFDNLYYYLITMPWRYFFGLMFCCYLVLNTVFAACYMAIGVEHLNGLIHGSAPEEFTEAYFFSTQTLTTVGYGRVNPQGLPANVLAAFESFTGLLAFALISGLLYGRFSRPKAKIVFSQNMLVAPYREGLALMFRMTNARKSELIETEAQIIVAINQCDDQGKVQRNFYPLKLEINRISFFSLSWTLVHPIDEQSPVYGFTEEDLRDSKAEFLILIKGTDEIDQQVVHARMSYVAESIVWNARFRPVITHTSRGLPLVLTRQIGDYEQLEVPAEKQ